MVKVRGVARKIRILATGTNSLSLDVQCQIAREFVPNTISPAETIAGIQHLAPFFDNEAERFLHSLRRGTTALSTSLEELANNPKYLSTVGEYRIFHIDPKQDNMTLAAYQAEVKLVMNAIRTVAAQSPRVVLLYLCLHDLDDFENYPDNEFAYDNFTACLPLFNNIDNVRTRITFWNGSGSEAFKQYCALNGVLMLDETLGEANLLHRATHPGIEDPYASRQR